MKTSLNIEDSLFKAAQNEAHQSGKTLSETIGTWARVGRDFLSAKKKKPDISKLKTMDLGPPLIDINCRREWMDALDE